MRRLHPGDYQDPKPWGSQGDRKCDGLLVSQGKLFSVYAPEWLTEAEALGKMKEDFQGALEQWREGLHAWVFVYNAPNVWEGPPPGVVAQLFEWQREHTPLQTEAWGPWDVMDRAMELSDGHLRDLLGPAPTVAELVQFDLADLAAVIEGIAARPAPPAATPVPVSPDKLRVNDLSSDVQQLVQVGMVGERKVRDYFESHPDPTHEAEICAAFTLRYAQLMDEGCRGDVLFEKLRDFAGTEARLTTPRDAAVFALLAYLFERCDIFEDPSAMRDAPTQQAP